MDNQSSPNLSGNAPAPPPAAARGPSVRQLAVVVAILGAGILLTALTSNVTKVSEPGLRLADGKPFLPEAVGRWQGSQAEGLSEAERAILPPDTEGTRRIYRSGNGAEVYCSVVLAGREVTSIHRPELCLPGQGWTIDAEHTESVPIQQASGGALKVMRMNASRSLPLAGGGVARHDFVFVYWFVGKERTTPYHWQRILWTTLDRVLHDRNHRWAYFLMNAVVPVDRANPNFEQASDATMKTLAGFIHDVYPSLAAEH